MSTCNLYKTLLMQYFTFFVVIVVVKFSKSRACFIYTAHIISDQLHFKCSVVTIREENPLSSTLLGSLHRRAL